MNTTLDPTVTLAKLRPLKWDELVRIGDFVENSQGFEPWDGPRGFRADAFVKQIYRRLKSQSARTAKPV
jgi:hypothetical protein